MKLNTQFHIDSQREAHKLPDIPNQKVFEQFKAFTSKGCYAAADKAYKHLPEEIQVQAAKVQEIIRPILELYEEGIERKERAEKNPADGPRPIHWFAIYLNDLNEATAIQDRNAAKRAIANLLYVDTHVKRFSSMPDNLRAMHQLCLKRIEEIDENGTLRHELTWGGSIKTGVKKVAVSCAIAGGVIGFIFASNYMHNKVYQTASDFFGSDISHAIGISLSSMGLYHAVRRENTLGVFLSGYFLYQKISTQHAV